MRPFESVFTTINKDIIKKHIENLNIFTDCSIKYVQGDYLNDHNYTTCFESIADSYRELIFCPLKKYKIWVKNNSDQDGYYSCDIVFIEPDDGEEKHLKELNDAFQQAADRLHEACKKNKFPKMLINSEIFN